MQTIKTYLSRVALVIIILSAGCSDDPDFASIPFSGPWTVESASHNLISNIDTGDWQGKTITFSQTNETEGTFTFPGAPDAPYETVWAKNGQWTKTGTNQFTRNDDIVVQYTRASNELTMTLTTPFVITFGCDSGYCTATILASWTFLLKKA